MIGRLIFLLSMHHFCPTCPRNLHIFSPGGPSNAFSTQPKSWITFLQRTHLCIAFLAAQLSVRSLSPNSPMPYSVPAQGHAGHRRSFSNIVPQPSLALYRQSSSFKLHVQSSSLDDDESPEEAHPMKPMVCTIIIGAFRLFLTFCASRTGVASVGFVGFPSVGKVRIMIIRYLPVHNHRFQSKLMSKLTGTHSEISEIDFSHHYSWYSQFSRCPNTDIGSSYVQVHDLLGISLILPISRNHRRRSRGQE